MLQFYVRFHYLTLLDDPQSQLNFTHGTLKEFQTIRPTCEISNKPLQYAD